MSEADLTMHSGTVITEPAFSVPAKKMAMWLFIIADAATFAACLVVYGFLRNGNATWPTPFKFSPTIINAMVMTFVLITSSLTMLFGVRAAKAWDKPAAFRWTMMLFHNPWGTSLFGASFFSITGLHLLHVSAGVVALITMGIRYRGGRYNADDLEVMGLYWHFVDLVWMFVVPFVYLLNVSR